MKPYAHEPFTDFSKKENQAAFLEGLKKVESYLGETYDLIIGGKRVETNDKIVSINPANKEEVIGYVGKATKEHAEEAMQVALKAFETWRKSKPEMRAEILFKAAHIVRNRKHEFSALLVKEAGKPWHEADADIAEGIDFMEYYGRQMLELKDGAPVLSRPGENNTYGYIPLGVGVTIPP